MRWVLDQQHSEASLVRRPIRRIHTRRLSLWDIPRIFALYLARPYRRYAALRLHDIDIDVQWHRPG